MTRSRFCPQCGAKLRRVARYGSGIPTEFCPAAAGDGDECDYGGGRP